MKSEIIDRTPTGFTKSKVKLPILGIGGMRGSISKALQEVGVHTWRTTYRGPAGKFCTKRSYQASARHSAKADKKVYDADKKKWGIKKPQTILDIWKPTRDKLKIPSLKTGSPPFYRKSKYGKRIHRQDTLQPITACNRRCSNWDYEDGPETCKHCLKSIPAGEM